MSPIMIALLLLASAFIMLLALLVNSLTLHNILNQRRAVPQAVEQGVPSLAVAAPATIKHDRPLNKRSVHKPSSDSTVCFSTSLITASSVPVNHGHSYDTQSGRAGAFHETGFSACSITGAYADYISAVSQLLLGTYPDHKSVNPNSKPVWGMMTTTFYRGKTVSVTTVINLDLSSSVFSTLADEPFGRIDIT